MSCTSSAQQPVGGHVTVRYWAGARASAGVSEERFAVDDPITLTEVRRRAVAAHPNQPRLADVLATCSALLGEQPVSSSDPDTVIVPAGSIVEFLPPFAGG